MVPSQRPTTVNRPKIRRPDDDGPTTTTPAIETALEHEAVYGSGVSGSTNIMLHLLEWMNKEGGAVDPKDFALKTRLRVVVYAEGRFDITDAIVKILESK